MKVCNSNLTKTLIMQKVTCVTVCNSKLMKFGGWTGLKLLLVVEISYYIVTIYSKIVKITVILIIFLLKLMYLCQYKLKLDEITTKTVLLTLNRLINAVKDLKIAQNFRRKQNKKDSMTPEVLEKPPTNNSWYF